MRSRTLLIAAMAAAVMSVAVCAPADARKLRLAPDSQATSPLSGVLYVKRPKFSIGNAKPMGTFDDVFAVKSERPSAGATPSK